MRIFGSSIAGKSTGMIFGALGASMVWGLVVGGLSAGLLDLSQRTSQMLGAATFAIVFACLVPAIRRVAKGGEPW
jgi:hypothetical protein